MVLLCKFIKKQKCWWLRGKISTTVQIHGNTIVFHHVHEVPQVDTQCFFLQVRRQRSHSGFLKQFPGEIKPAAAFCLCIFNARRTRRSGKRRSCSGASSSCWRAIKRRPCSGASSLCWRAREDHAAERQVYVGGQEKIMQRSIKFMLEGKRRSCSGVSSWVVITPPPHPFPETPEIHQEDSRGRSRDSQTSSSVGPRRTLRLEGHRNMNM